jgi:hypothetical protein
MHASRTLLVVAGLATAGLTTLAAPANAATTAASAAPAARAAACDKAPWADRVQGAPDGFTAGVRGGDYLWHDAKGFHLRVTHKGDNRVVYSGVITSPTPMRIDPVKLERGDVAKLSANHRSLVFAFADYGHIDGVNFHTDCAATITVSNLNADNAKLTPDRVYLGDAKAHPPHIPFTVHRNRA